MRLSPQQYACAALLREALTNAEIAQRVGVQTHTVREHLHRAMQHTGARNRVELALMVERGIVRPALREAA